MTEDQLQSPLTDREHVAGRRLPTITDEYMRERLGQARSYTIETKPYTLGLLRTITNHAQGDTAAVVWEHMRRMMALMADGLLVVVLGGAPAGDPDWAGVGVFDTTPERLRAILDSDPCVEAGICGYEIHPIVGFPGRPISPA